MEQQERSSREDDKQGEFEEQEYLTVPVFKAMQSTMMEDIAALISSKFKKLKLQDQGRNQNTTRNEEPDQEDKNDEDSTDDGENQGPTGDRNSHRTASAVAQSIALKTMSSQLPQYDGKGTIQRLLEFVEKMDSYFDIAELPPITELNIAVTRLTGTANLFWREHKSKFPKDTKGRFRTWKELKEGLMKFFAPPDNERMVFEKLRYLNQGKLSVSDYVENFTYLTMQLPGLREQDAINFFLSGLRQDIRQMIESNTMNLTDISTMKLAAIRQERILNPKPARPHPRDDGATALTTSEDYHRRGRGRGSYRGRGRGQPQSIHRRDLSKIQCHVCNKFGHYATRCPRVQEIIKQEKEKNKDRTYGTTIKKEDETKESTSMAKALFARTEDPMKNREVNFIIDSGATQHMTPHENHFEEFTQTEREIAVANDVCIKAKGIGNIPVMFHSNEKKAIMKDVLYVPDLAHPLLSISAVNDKGIDVTFKRNGQVVFEDDDGTIGEGKRVGNLYQLTASVKEASTDEEQALSATQVNQYELWHRRMGHLGAANLQKLPNIVEGLKGVNLKSPNQEICEGCMNGRQNRLPFDDSTSSYELLELIHSDVCGPMQTLSIGGSRYVITFTDHYSHTTKCYYLPDKKAATCLEKFKEYKAQTEAMTGKKIKILRTDGGGEYINEAFQDYLKENGIQHQRSIRYTPQQNGVAERINRTLEEKTRSMLHSAKLPYRLWAEIWETACYLHNRSPVKALQKENKTPQEAFYGQKPNISNLRAIGSLAFVHIPNELRSKLEPKTRKLTLVGYAINSKGYRIWDQDTDKIIESRDIVFDEGKLGVNEREDKETSSLFEQEYQVECILDERQRKGQREFLIKWTGYEESDNTWEPYHHIKDTAALDQWEERQNFAMLSTVIPNNDPQTVTQALKGEDGHYWKEAMNEEYKSLIENNTWEIVPRPQHRATIDGRWVFWTKRNIDGSVKRHKARFVARGFSQTPGSDYDETFSPVVSHSALRLIMALAVRYQLQIHQMDVKTAFLNGKIDAEIYMEQPEGYDTEFPRKKFVCKLKKALYGLKQAGRLWNQTLHKYLIEQDYQQLNSEPCVYIRRKEDTITIIAIYVDDIKIATNNTEALESAKNMLKTRFKMTDLGPVHHILGLRVLRKEDSISIDQAHYIETVLEKYRMKDCHPLSTPLDTNIKLGPLEEGQKKFDDKSLYRAAVGSLMFAAVTTRPDIATAVNMVARFVEDPAECHWTAVKRIMRYLRGTTNYGLIYRNEGEDLIAYCDADWAGDVSERRSTTGYVIKFAGAAISWKSSKQACTALSTVEAEYIAAATAAKEVIWLRRLFNEMQSHTINKLDRPTTMKIDNNGALNLAKNHQISQRTKHIDIKYHFIRQCVSNEEILLEYCPTEKMTADILTKALPTIKFEEFRAELGVLPVGAISKAQ